MDLDAVRFFVRVLVLLPVTWMSEADRLLAQVAQPTVSDFKVTLLGTSTPNPLPDRFGLGIPAKLNTSSGGKPNGIPG